LYGLAKSPKIHFGRKQGIVLELVFICIHDVVVGLYQHYPMLRLFMSRLLAEKMNKEERKNMGEIFVFNEGQELAEFWKGLCGESEKPAAPIQVSFRILVYLRIYIIPLGHFILNLYDRDV